MSERLSCKCFDWARTDTRFLTEHHPECPKYDLVSEMNSIISDLLDGIRAWASDEDGVHPSCWDAALKAMIFTGRIGSVPSPHLNKTEEDGE